MKQSFSTSWKSSRQVRKQRKYRYNAPLHIRHKFLSANLSKPLREKYGKRSLPLRKGDEVLVMRGTFSKKKGKITSVDLKYAKIAIEGIQRQKKDGTKVNVFFNPSVLQIHSLNLDDKQRVAILDRKSKPQSSSPKEK
jgi:large subunit ribosomal protein L24